MSAGAHIQKDYVVSIRSMAEAAWQWYSRFDAALLVSVIATAAARIQSSQKALLEDAKIGRMVQERLLPDIPEEIMDLEIGYVYSPSGDKAQVGGDIVDVFMLEPGQAAFIIGDFCGHGPEVAADAAIIRYLFRGFMRDSEDLVGAITKMNRVLKSEFGDGSFATALAGKYTGDGNLQLVSAGHPASVLCDTDYRVLEEGGIALAVDENSR